MGIRTVVSLSLKGNNFLSRNASVFLHHTRVANFIYLNFKLHSLHAPVKGNLYMCHTLFLSLSNADLPDPSSRTAREESLIETDIYKLGPVSSLSVYQRPLS